MLSCSSLMVALNCVAAAFTQNVKRRKSSDTGGSERLRKKKTQNNKFSCYQASIWDPVALFAFYSLSLQSFSLSVCLSPTSGPGYHLL